MNIHRFRALHGAGASYVEIAASAAVIRRTVCKYLAEDAPSVPPAGPLRAGTPSTGSSTTPTSANQRRGARSALTQALTGKGVNPLT